MCCLRLVNYNYIIFAFAGVRQRTLATVATAAIAAIVAVAVAVADAGPSSFFVVAVAGLLLLRNGANGRIF